MSIACHAERRVSTPGVLVLVAAACAWLIALIISDDMGAMPGTMGLNLAGFVGVWTVMIAAMMLPLVTSLASMYERSLLVGRGWRLGAFVAGYLLVWAAAGVPAFGLAVLVGDVAPRSRGSATATAVIIFAACGLYQLTPLKDRCLARCRASLHHLRQYASWRGRLRDLRVGLHHGAYSLGCCWALMVVLLAFGMMNVAAMLVLAAMMSIEKVFLRGEALSRLVGVLALALAFAVIWAPGLAPGLHPPSVAASHMAGM
jgi:predicted metal-binding membrane protein